MDPIRKKPLLLIALPSFIILQDDEPHFSPHTPACLRARPPQLRATHGVQQRIMKQLIALLLGS